MIRYFFGRRAGARTQRRDGHRARFTTGAWRAFHYACAAGIGVAVAYIGLTEVSGWPDAYRLIIGETAAVLCFGASWLAKGLEIDILGSAAAQVEAGATEKTAAGQVAGRCGPVRDLT